MEIENKIQENFKNINNVFFVKELGIKYLKIEVNFTKLEKITNITKEISIFLDKNFKTEEEYFLDIYSPGADEYFDVKDSLKYIKENVKVYLLNYLNEKKEYVGKLLDYSNEQITIEWNDKGQFRKQVIELKNIDKIQKYI